MSAAVVLVDESTGRVAVTLEGVVRYTRIYAARVTTRTVSDRSPQADSVLREAVRVQIEGSIATTSVPDGYPVGPARVLQVRAALRALQASGASVTFAPDGDDPLPSMVVESISTDRDVRKDPGLTITLVERRSATRRQIELAPLPAVPAGPPRPDVAAGLQIRPSGAPSALELSLVDDRSRVATFVDFGAGFLQ